MGMDIFSNNAMYIYVVLGCKKFIAVDTHLSGTFLTEHYKLN